MIAEYRSTDLKPADALTTVSQFNVWERLLQLLTVRPAASTPEKRRRKPGMSLNGDRSVEGMGHGRECGGGVGMARLCGVWCVEGVERGKECGGRGRGRWKVGKGREKRREIYCLHSKQTTSHCLACGNHSNHLPPLTPPLKQQHLSATLTLRHFTHYMLRSTLYTLYFTL